MRRMTSLMAVMAFVVGASNAQPSQFENVYTYFQKKTVEGRPFLQSINGDFWDCMSVNLYGNTSSRLQVDSVFQGYEDETEPFFNAAKRCGFFYLAAPYEHTFVNETVDLGLSISYTTPGITAQNLPFGRPPGIEQIADPSAVKLPDGRIALFFSGDHREAFQSTRWVTKDPITAFNQPLQFEIEQDYDLSERLLWKHLFRESNGTWTAFGDLDGFKKWTSLDGLDWQESGEVISMSPPPTVVRASLGLSPNQRQFDSFISLERVGENEWIGVIPHYREGLDAETADPNGNGYDDPPFVLIYSSSDGVNWTYESYIIGPAEGFVEKLDSQLYAFSLYDTVLLSTDLKQWGFGLTSHFTTRGIALEDGYTLTFATRSREGIPTFAHKVEIDMASWPAFYTLPATYENLPTLNQINGTNVAIEQQPAPTSYRSMNRVDLFPNPIHTQATLVVDIEKKGRVRVELFDVLGRKIETVSDQMQSEGTVEIDISVGGLSSGLYMLVGRTAQGMFTKRVHIIQ